MHGSRSVRPSEVIPDGKNVVSHAGAALLAELADRSGLIEAMSVGMSDCGISCHTHDPGVVLTHLAVTIAGGADCLADIAALKSMRISSVRRHLWRQRGGPCTPPPSPSCGGSARCCPSPGARLGGGVTRRPDDLGLRFHLWSTCPRKKDAAATYKRGFGFNPLGAWCDNTKEPLAAMLPRATSPRGTPTTTSNSSSRWSCRSRSSTNSATKKVTIPPSLSIPSWSGPTRPGPRTALSGPSPMPTSSSRLAFPSAGLCVTPCWPIHQVFI